jgi:acetyl-CoA/propionyl-CoA carboxylase biotin carboxyl carrier protein
VSFGTVLVANRGEIAVRVIRAARAEGLRTVAVYSDADAGAPHVRSADTAVRIGPAPAAESYLSIPALLAAARRSGADAVHPGYGFLSESAAFAAACAEAGLVFVGPPASVMARMGRKDRARGVAIAAAVPVIPAVESDEPGELISRAAGEIGFPLLIKAAAGGGGRGMRIVHRAADLAVELAAARHEAGSAFGDDTMLIERYVDQGRHVEVQVVADSQGHVVHLLERDCSVQRRHQKIVEEAPAPTISEAVRRRLTEAAVGLAREVGYVNAGTVEFLVRGEEVYFLEMNTRLQVEHPVTELITGLDLVALQLQIAQGRPLPFAQEEVRPRGHAIEARVYAEDTGSGFLPQAGVASLVRWSERARVDAALEPGQAVGTWYDPMLGKIIAHGPDRDAARRSLLAAIDDTAIFGLTTNLGFLRRLCASDQFGDVAIDTAWLDRNPGAFPAAESEEAVCAAAWLVAANPPSRDPRHPFAVLDGWRLAAAPAPTSVSLERNGTRQAVSVDLAAGAVAAGERRWRVRALPAGAGRLRLEIDGAVVELPVEIGRETVTVGHRGETYTFSLTGELRPPEAATDSDGMVTAPMPGIVVAVEVRHNDTVAAGTTLGVLEAMKMEITLSAPRAGRVERIGAAVGDRVSLGQILFRIAPDDEAR